MKRGITLGQWLATIIPKEERGMVRRSILRMIYDHPKLRYRHSWPELRAMAERNGYNVER